MTEVFSSPSFLGIAALSFFVLSAVFSLISLKLIKPEGYMELKKESRSKLIVCNVLLICALFTFLLSLFFILKLLFLPLPSLLSALAISIVFSFLIYIILFLICAVNYGDRDIHSLVSQGYGPLAIISSTYPFFKYLGFATTALTIIILILWLLGVLHLN